MRFIRRYRFSSLANLRKEFARILAQTNGPLLICPNHVTYIDSLIVICMLASASFYLRHFFAFPWNFPNIKNVRGNPLYRAVCYIGKCLLITRGGTQKTKIVMEKAGTLLSQGDYLMIFPEGTRSITGKIDREHYGYGVGQLLLAVPNTQVLCVYIHNPLQKGASILPAKGSHFHLSLQLLAPHTRQKGMRAMRDLTRQVMEVLWALESEQHNRNVSPSLGTSGHSPHTALHKGSTNTSHNDTQDLLGQKQGSIAIEAKVGNDIVDLGLPQTQGKHRDVSFLQRVFTHEEQSAILASPFPDKLLWALWAAKESAFKAYQKIHISVIFAHRKFAVSRETLSFLSRCDFSLAGEYLSGLLSYQDQRFALSWEWNADYVHAIAVSHEIWDKRRYHRIDDLSSLEKSAAGKEKTVFSELERTEIYGRPSALVRWQAKCLLAQVARDSEATRANGKDHFDPAEFTLLRPTVVVRGQERKGPIVIYRGQQTITEYDISLSHDGRWVASTLLTNRH